MDKQILEAASGLNIIAPYVPAANFIVEEVLKLGRVNFNDQILDLGCGDGRFLTLAQKRVPISGRPKKCIGVELNPVLVQRLQSQIQEENLTDLIEVYENDIMDLKLEQFNATFIIVHLLPDQLEKLKPSFEEWLTLDMYVGLGPSVHRMAHPGSKKNLLKTLNSSIKNSLQNLTESLTNLTSSSNWGSIFHFKKLSKEKISSNNHLILDSATNVLAPVPPVPPLPSVFKGENSKSAPEVKKSSPPKIEPTSASSPILSRSNRNSKTPSEAKKPSKLKKLLKFFSRTKQKVSSASPIPVIEIVDFDSIPKSHNFEQTQRRSSSSSKSSNRFRVTPLKDSVPGKILSGFNGDEIIAVNNINSIGSSNNTLDSDLSAQLKDTDNDSSSSVFLPVNLRNSKAGSLNLSVSSNADTSVKLPASTQNSQVNLPSDVLKNSDAEILGFMPISSNLHHSDKLSASMKNSDAGSFNSLPSSDSHNTVSAHSLSLPVSVHENNNEVPNDKISQLNASVFIDIDLHSVRETHSSLKAENEEKSVKTPFNSHNALPEDRPQIAASAITATMTNTDVTDCQPQTLLTVPSTKLQGISALQSCELNYLLAPQIQKYGNLLTPENPPKLTNSLTPEKNSSKNIDKKHIAKFTSKTSLGEKEVCVVNSRRIVSVMFSIPGWNPVETIQVSQKYIKTSGELILAKDLNDAGSMESIRESDVFNGPGIWLFLYDIDSFPQP